jgi:membrane-bound ClpP family serine protease
MTTILPLFVLGVVLLALDLFVPGVLLSIGGVIAFLIATAEAFRVYGMIGGLEAFGCGIVLLAAALWLEYGLLPKTSFGKRFFHRTAVDATSQPSEATLAAFAGREAETLTPLMPTGQIEILGRRYEARSLDGHVPKGAKVKIVGAQNFSVTVTKL